MTVHNLSNPELQQLMQASPHLQLLDVRTPEEYWHLGHIPGARLLPIHELPGQLQTLDQNRPVAVVCEHGIRSMDASYFLVQQGFENVSNLTAGMAEWNGPREFASKHPAPSE